MKTSAALAVEPCPKCTRLRYSSDCRTCQGEGQIRLRAVEPGPTQVLSAYAIERCTEKVAGALIDAGLGAGARADAPGTVSMLVGTMHHGRVALLRRAERRHPGHGERVVCAFVEGLRDHASVLEYNARLSHEPGEARRLRATVRALGGEET